MRPIEVSDADVVANWYQKIDDVTIFDRQTPLPVSHVEVVALVKSLVSGSEKGKCRWFVVQDSDGNPIGMGGLENINLLHGHAVMPAFIAEPWRRSGLGTRMVCMMLDLAFKQLRLHRVATIHRADNKTSEALLERLEFKREGISRQSWFSQGQYFDLMQVAILANEWNQVRESLRATLGRNIILELGPEPSAQWQWPALD